MDKEKKPKHNKRRTKHEFRESFLTYHNTFKKKQKLLKTNKNKQI